MQFNEIRKEVEGVVFDSLRIDKVIILSAIFTSLFTPLEISIFLKSHTSFLTGWSKINSSLRLDPDKDRLYPKKPNQKQNNRHKLPFKFFQISYIIES